MRRRQFIASAGGVGAAAGLAGAAAAQEGEDPRTGSGTQDDPYVVGMYTEGSEFYFSPVGLYVEAGDYVEWVIESGGHSATSYSPGNPDADVSLIPDGADPWDSGVLSDQGASFTYQFQETGTYDYYCIPHKTLGMVGVVVCGEPGGPGEANQGEMDGVGSGVIPDSETIVEGLALDYPYFPETGGGPLPGLALGAAALFALANVYLLSQADRYSGRYDDDVPDDRDV